MAPRSGGCPPLLAKSARSQRRSLRTERRLACPLGANLPALNHDVGFVSPHVIISETPMTPMRCRPCLLHFWAERATNFSTDIAHGLSHAYISSHVGRKLSGFVNHLSELVVAHAGTASSVSQVTASPAQSHHISRLGCD